MQAPSEKAVHASLEKEAIQLHKLIRRKNWLAARKIIEAHQDVQSLLDGRDHYGDNALSIAICWKAPNEFIFDLINLCEESVFSKNEVGSSALHNATIWGTTYEVLRVLIDKNPGGLNERNGDGNTPEDYLERNKLDERSKELIKAGRNKPSSPGVDVEGQSVKRRLKTIPEGEEDGMSRKLRSLDFAARRNEEERYLLKREVAELKELLEAEHARNASLEKNVSMTQKQVGLLSKALETTISEMKSTLDLLFNRMCDVEDKINSTDVARSTPRELKIYARSINTEHASWEQRIALFWRSIVRWWNR